MTEPDEGLYLKAFPCYGPDVDGLEIVPAHQQRDWMSEMPLEDANQFTPGKVEVGLGNRCLPLLMANQMGWNVISNASFMATSMPDGRIITHWEENKPRFGCPQHNFDGNLLTWPLPWTFETSPGWDLLLLPPPNVFMPTGVDGLMAMVETDHVPASFTYNWHIKPGLSIFVNKGDIVCRLLPYPTGELERFRLEMNEAQQPGYHAWLVSRTNSFTEGRVPGAKWQAPYFKIAKRLKIKGKD